MTELEILFWAGQLPVARHHYTSKWPLIVRNTRTRCSVSTLRNSNKLLMNWHSIGGLTYVLRNDRRRWWTCGAAQTCGSPQVGRWWAVLLPMHWSRQRWSDVTVAYGWLRMDLGPADTFHKVPRGCPVHREERTRGKIKLAPLREIRKVRRTVVEINSKEVMTTGTLAAIGALGRLQTVRRHGALPG